MVDSTRLAVVGAGPMGVEAAARAVADEHDFRITVYEAGRIGEHVRTWGHVQLFSPWRLNRSRWGTRRLRDVGEELADDRSCPTAAEYLTEYLEPVAQTLRDDVEFCLDTKVVEIGRRSVLKSEQINGDRRREAPFILRVDGPEGLRFDTADAVIDATGVLSNPNPIGPGGLAAVGERRFGDRITRRIPNVDAEGHDFANRTILVVGHGHSALTTLAKLKRLRERAEGTEIVWAYREAGEPRVEIEDDPLEERSRLDRFGNAASRGEIDGVEPVEDAVVRRIDDSGDGLAVTLEAAGQRQKLTVDRIVANVGYRPDLSLCRELQVHLCYATEGPMNLAASLLAETDGVDCLAQSAGGIETLRSPEPNFFMVGAKSYGRNPNFLLNIGFEQINEVFAQGLEPKRGAS